MQKLLIYNLTIPKTINILMDKNFLYIKNDKYKTFFLLLNNFYIYKKNNLIFLTLKKKNYLNNHLISLNSLNSLKLYYKLLINKILGVSNGFFSQLECKGLGYKAKIKGNSLILNLGFSHTLNFIIPNYINVFCSKSNNIIFFSNDKQKLYEFIYKIRAYKKPDSYKGKGLKLKFEIIKLKEGKKV